MSKSLRVKRQNNQSVTNTSFSDYSIMQHMEVSILMSYFQIPLCRPAYGGKFCEGSTRSYKLCNTQNCPPNTVDYRAQQCAEFNSKQFRGWYYTWRPYTRVDGETF